jgi:hypothetical protein
MAKKSGSGKKIASKKGVSEKELEREVSDIEQEFESPSDNVIKSDISVKASKPLAKVKKGDKMTIDGKQYEVDAHYVLIDHGSTKEMALEIFDSKTDKDYQLRYFSDQAENTLELYELQEIMYVKKPFSKISW